MEWVLIVLIILLVVACWKWWSYRCAVIGLIYFASLEHNWKVSDDEMKQILNYSMRRNAKDLFK